MWILRTNYHLQLFKLFDACEAANNLDALYKLFRVWRALLFANNVTLLELILAEDCILHFFGALEYDPRIAPERRCHHRQFLQATQLKEVNTRVCVCLFVWLCFAERMGCVGCGIGQ